MHKPLLMTRDLNGAMNIRSRISQLTLKFTRLRSRLWVARKTTSVTSPAACAGPHGEICMLRADFKLHVL